MLFDKPPLQSRKFVAYLVAEMTWKIALLVLLILGMKEAKIDIFVGTIALAMVIVAGAIEALYIGGVTALDKYTRIAQIAATAGHSFEMKGVKLTSNGKGTLKPKIEEDDLSGLTDGVEPEEG